MTPPSILALHGNLGQPSDWEGLGLEGVLAPELWQFSSTSFEEFSHTLYEDLTRDLQRPLLVGYSLGGRLALHSMALNPEHWAGAVLLSTHPGLTSPAERTARLASDTAWAQKARQGSWKEFLELWNRQPIFSKLGAKDPIESPRWTLTQLGLEPRRHTIADAFVNWSLGNQEDMRHRLRHFRAPVLWITGAADTKFTTLGASMAGIFPRFHHEVIAGCGHRLLQEAPSRLRDLIEGFRNQSLQGKCK